MVFLSPGNARFGGKRGHGRVDLQTLSLSLFTLFSQPFPHPFLPANGFIPSRHSTHRQVVGATLIGPWQSLESASCEGPSEGGNPKKRPLSEYPFTLELHLSKAIVVEATTAPSRDRSQTFPASTLSLNSYEL